MTTMSEISGSLTLRARVPGEATAGSVDTWVLGLVPKCTVTGIKWVPDAAVTGANTDNFALAVQNKGSGSGSTALTTTKTYASATNSVAATAESLTLTSTTADLDCAANDVVAMVRSKNGNGLASPAGVVEITYKLR